MGWEIITADFSFKKGKNLDYTQGCKWELSQPFQAALKLPVVADFPCLLLSFSVLGASSPREAVVTAFQLIPFVQGSISILDILIFFLELEDTFRSQLVHPPHFTDENSEPQHM